ncbi:MAG: S8 family peptidase [Bacteroidales bacterium]|nr:S8 family peptidase [Bacteroidales bacterium]
MKKLFILFLTAVCCMAGYAQAVIDPLLIEEMGRRNDDEQIKVLVIMKSQYDRTQLNRRADYFATRAERREFVVNELKAFAEASQYDLKRSLTEMERNGMVSSPTVIWMANALYFDATKAAINDLARRNDIEMMGFAKEYNWIPEDDAPRPAMSTREITQNVIQVGANQVWDQGYMGQGVVVAVIDTGVNYNHVDLADHLWDGGSEFPHHGYDVKNNDNDPMDDHGHGSHCSGTVLGDGKAGSQTGMAPAATLMCVKCLDASGNGGAQNISLGIQWAVEHGCDLFSMSLGLPNSSIPDRTLLRHTCEAALDAGIVAAIAAGNEGNQTWMYPIPNNVRVPGSCPPPYMDAVQGENPGDLTCSVCVGAVDYNDNAAYFTSRGPVTWQNTEFSDYPYQPGIGLIRPDVCAPGVDIKSLNYQSNTGYTYMSGTSMATPCVAGCMALMLSKDINLSPSEVCRILEETAVPLAEGKSNTYGFGRVDVLAAVDAIQMGAVQYNDIYQINDEAGNQNGRLNPGESVTMGVVMANLSPQPVSNISMVLTTGNGNVTITQNTATCPDLAPGEAQMVEEAFAFTVNDQVMANQTIRFNLEVYVDGVQTGTYGLVVTVFDDQLEYGTTAVLNDDNGDGLLNPGETADLRIFVDNLGNQLAEMVVGTLSTNYEFVTVNGAEGNFSTIGAELMGYADFNVTLDAAAPDDFVIPFTLDLVDFNGKHTELTFSYRNTCNVIFSLHDSGNNGWQGCYLTVAYSGDLPTEQMTIEEGGSAIYTRHVTSGSRIMLVWHSEQGASQCSFEVTYEDGTVIFENQGGFSGNKVFEISCTIGSSGPGFCEPVRNLTYTTDGNRVDLTWEAPENPACFAYEVWRGSTQLAVSPATEFTDYVEEGVYDYCVYACYNDCQSEYVCAEVEVSKCSPVQNLTHTMTSDLECTLSWGAPQNTAGLLEYQIFMDEVLLGATNELTYSFTIPTGEHDINVKAVFEECGKDAFIHICILDAVENLAYTLENSTATVTWDAIEGITQYWVEVNGQVGPYVEGTQYVFEVEDGLTSVKVTPVSETCYTLDAEIEVCYCKPVEDLSFVTMGDTGLLRFIWSDVSNVEYYEVVHNGTTTQVAPEGGGTTVFNFDAVVGTNTICVTVHSVYGCDSEPVCMMKEVCAAVDGFDYSFVGNEVTVTWNDVADLYAIWGEYCGTPDYIETNSITFVLVEEDFRIWVMPVYEECLAFTAEFGSSINNMSPQINIIEVREGLIATAWNAVDGTIAYNLYRDGELMAENLTETNYNDTEMAIDMQHCYAVQSVFEKGVSSLSEEACANYFHGLNENDGKVAVFPNPTSDKVTIECVGMTLIEVYTTEGKLVQRIKVEGDAYQLEGLESGVYTLRIMVGDETIVRRVIKM